MKKTFLRKFINVLSALAIISQSLTPYAVLLPQTANAQETTVTPTDTPTPTIDQSQPTDTATPTPTVDQTNPTDTVTPAPTDVPTDTVTPAPDQTATPTDTPSVDNNSPPSNDQTSNTSGLTGASASSVNTTTSPTVTIDPTQDGLTTSNSNTQNDESVNFTILKNVSAPTLDLNQAADSGSASLSTDKADYAPTDTALITGAGFTAGETYTLLITSVNNYSFSTSVTIDSEGKFAYAYQLDGTYRPNYVARVQDDSGATLASTTFTDSAPAPISEQNTLCVADQPTAPSHLTCTANDISIASVNNVNIVEKSFDGGNTFISSSGQNCDYPGQFIKFTASWSVQSSATSRYNVGLWFANQGQTSALHGQCSATTLPDSPSPFFESSDDLCGDIHSGSTGTVSPAITVIAQCKAAPGTNQLNLPYCSSWDENEKAGNACNGPEGTVPGTPSKCGCNNSNPIPITVPPGIEVIKNLVPSNDPGLFNLLVNDDTKKTDAGNTGTTGVVTIATGQNTFGEAAGTGTSLSGYASSVSCVLRGTQTTVATTGSNPWTIANVTNGQDIVCTITNTLQAGSLKIVKNTTGGNTTFNYTVTGPTPLTPSITTVAGTGSSGPTSVNSGTNYAITESVPAGWTFGSASCDKAFTGGANGVTGVTVVAGQTTTCTFNNTKQATLTVNKSCTPSNDTGKFNLRIDGSVAGTGADATCGGTTGAVVVSAASHTVSELAGTGTNLSDYTAVIGGDCASNGTLTVAAGDTKVCTITNTRKPKLTVHKDVINHGGNKTTASFAPYNVDGNAVSLDVASTYSIGSHTVTETPDSNYTATFSGGCDSSGHVTLAAGDNKTCTITNEEKQATIVVHKTVINHGLSNNASHFAPYKVGTTTVVLDAVTNIDSGTYTVSEASDANYTATFSGDCNAQGQVTVTAGSAKSCTITNEENATHLKVTKVVINHGGNKVVADFPLFIDGNSVTSGANNLVNSGNHTVSETANTNYTATFSGDCNAQGVVTLGSGQHKICTITNEEKLSDITVKKIVINHGGNKVATDFGPYKVDTTTVALNQANTFDSGNHTVSETTDPKYTQTFSGDCNSNGVVSLGSGEHKTCTITNEENAAKLIVTKVVVGGTAKASDFPLFVDQTSVTSGATNTFDSGSHVVSETNQSGYTQTGITGDCDSNGNVTLVAGQIKSCTITNTRDQGTIELKKVWSGTAGQTTLNIGSTNGGTDVASQQTGAAGTAPLTTDPKTVDTNTYYVSETGGLSNYDSGLVCTDNGNPIVPGANNSLVVAKNHTVVCTYTNTRQTGSLRVLKNVDLNGDGDYTDAGETRATDWNWQANGGPDHNTGDSAITVDTGNYQLSESQKTGFHFVSLACSGGTLNTSTNTVPVGNGANVVCTFTNAVDTGTIVVHKDVQGPNGQDVTDTSHNFTVEMDGANDHTITDGGTVTYTNVPTTSNHTITESVVDSHYDLYGISLTAGNSGNTSGLSVSVTKGHTTDVYVTNRQHYGSITVHKLVDRTGDNTYVSGDDSEFTWTLDGSGNYVMGDTNSQVVPGNRLVGENDVTDYHFVGWFPTGDKNSDNVPYSCTNLPNDNLNDYTVLPIHVNVGPDGTSEFTLCNQVDFGTVTVNKSVVSVSSDSGVFNLLVDDNVDASGGDGTTTGKVIVLTTGTHNVSETGGDNTNLNDYTSDTTCSSDNQDHANVDPTDFTVANGENITCDITNTRKGKVIVTKYDDVKGNGQVDEGDGVLSGWTINLDQNSGVTNGNGKVEFDDVLPGGHSLSENLQNGWEQTNLFCDNQQVVLEDVISQLNQFSNVNVSAGETVNCSILNHNLKPVITISKENDTEGNPKADGDIVTYTITVTLDESGGPADNLEVTDLLPEGFHYNGGSYQVLLNGVDHTGDYGEPTYHSPGVWSLGSANPGDVFKLIYKATIDGSEATGTYPDNAWAQGTPVGSSDVILANAVNPGDLDTSDPTSSFVGTQVAIVSPNNSGTGFKANTTQDVLGASTFLPATGEDTIWVIMATLLGIAGLGTLFAGFRLRKKNWYER